MSEESRKRRLKTKGETRPANPAVASAIGTKLRALYDEVLTEPVPDQLAELVRRLTPKGQTGDNGSGSP